MISKEKNKFTVAEKHGNRQYEFRTIVSNVSSNAGNPVVKID